VNPIASVGPLQLTAFLSEQYSLPVTAVEPAPRGWTADAFVVTTPDARYFLKVYDNERLPPAALPALPVLEQLHAHGLTEISRSLRSIRGAFAEPFNGHTAVLFHNIDAEPATAVDVREVVALLARLHDATATVDVSVVSE
jgi:Ser/Thr protein kinase RdoA (MazF antagonist)